MKREPYIVFPYQAPGSTVVKPLLCAVDSILCRHRHSIFARVVVP